MNQYIITEEQLTDIEDGDLTLQQLKEIRSHPYNPQAEPCPSFIPNDFYRKSDETFCVERFCRHWKPEKRRCIDLDPAAGSTYSIEEAHCELREGEQE